MIVAFTTFHHAAIILHDSDQTKTEQQQPRRSSTSQAQTSPEQTRYASTRDQTTQAKTRQHQRRDETRSDKSRPDRTTVDQTRREDTRRSERRPIEGKTSQKKTREDQSREHQRISDKTTHDMTAQKTKRNCSHCRNVPKLGCDLVEMSTAKRFRFNIADLFLSNDFGSQSSENLCDAGDAGAEGVADLRRLGSKKHVHRNLLTKLLEKLQEEEVSDVPVLLPRELIAAFRSEWFNLDHLLSTSDMDTTTRTHLESTSTSLGLDGNVIGLGIWLDGVCCEWDRSSNIEMITLSLPGVTGRWRALRVPVACVGRYWMMKALRNRDWKWNAPSQFHLCRYCGAFNLQTRLRNAGAHIRRPVCCGGLACAVRSSGAVPTHKARRQRVSGERRKEATTGRPTTSH